jgi:uncharacterized protein (DUF58 family)
VAAPPHAALSAEDLARAVRLLSVRSRREATGLFAGNYASAFRGSGIEFEESRPYAPGDDVAAFDWNATARTGEPHVKRFRAERNQTLVFALDVSASMRLGPAGAGRAATAAHALALLAAAAGRAGDRLALLAFADGVREAVPVGRGAAHRLRVTRAALAQAADARGSTRLAEALRALRACARQRSVLVLLSDFRDPELLPPESAAPRLRIELARLSRRHDVIAAPILDPTDLALPRAGSLLVADPERGGSRLLHSGRRSVRQRYAQAAERWRARLEAELRGGGAEVLWLRTDRSPLHALARFFRERAARRAAA